MSPVIAVSFGGRPIEPRKKVTGVIRALRNQWQKWGNGEEGRKGAHVAVVEVGREVTGFVRIFARPMRDASRDRIVVSKNIIERV